MPALYPETKNQAPGVPGEHDPTIFHGDFSAEDAHATMRKELVPFE